MNFNVPFIPDNAYIDFIDGLGDRLYAVHYSLYHPALSDARIRLRSYDTQTLAGLLQSVSAPKKYLLANGRFHPADSYAEAEGLDDLIGQLSLLKSADVLDGIIFSDPYLLLALSDAAPELASQTEAVPSVNFMIDSAEKFSSIVEIISQTRFQPPGKISVDRSLNRRFSALWRLSREIRRTWPDVKIELLANEGCLNHCPFRQTHEALIAAANTGSASFDTYRINRDLGCRNVLSEAPHLIFSSPFIRPEDLHRYGEFADILKICGRTLGRAFLIRAIQAYAEEQYHGNLTDLLDASNWMAEQWKIENDRIPGDFIDRVTACDQLCGKCGNCKDLFRKTSQSLPFSMADFRSSN